MMVIVSNQLPKSGTEFPTAWVDEFKRELIMSALRRAGIVTNTLLIIEVVLLMSDFYRTRWLETGADAIFIWRVTALVFLISYRLAIERMEPELMRLRYFLIFGMFLCCWASAALAGVTGDMSTFTIGALGVAAACPLPGRFNASLFTVFGAALIGWLYFHFPDAGPFWASNIIATCLIGAVIERFTFAAVLREFSHRKGIEKQRELADKLLYNVFPESVATALKKGDRSIALHGEVTILFADVVNFTQLSSRLMPSHLLDLLEELFGKFDQLAQKHGVEKIKTIGDAYMAVSGVPMMVDHPVERMADFALDVVGACKDIALNSGFDLAVRVGFHTGPAVAGVIGNSRLCYDLWGDSVNIAERIKAQSEPNAISVTEPIYFKLRKQFLFEDRGLVELKGKGPTKIYLLKSRLAAPANPSASHVA
ncbi:MAG: adenylate/guanylate cyclase domain-containing protein [Rhodoferax sp.]